MKTIDAALTAFYPVIFLMGVLIWMRFFPLLRSVELTTKPLICSMLVIVTGVMFEQLIYGWGRYFGSYIDIATNQYLVALGKILYMAGFSYLLYAFWLLSTAKPRLWISMALAGLLWLAIFGALV